MKSSEKFKTLINSTFLCRVMFILLKGFWLKQSNIFNKPIQYTDLKYCIIHKEIKQDYFFKIIKINPDWLFIYVFQVNNENKKLVFDLMDDC